MFRCWLKRNKSTNYTFFTSSPVASKIPSPAWALFSISLALSPSFTKPMSDNSSVNCRFRLAISWKKWETISGHRSQQIKGNCNVFASVGSNEAHLGWSNQDEDDLVWSFPEGQFSLRQIGRQSERVTQKVANFRKPKDHLFDLITFLKNTFMGSGVRLTSWKF